MVHFGILGAGNIAHSFCGAANKTEDACVLAVASKELDRARAWAEQEAVPRAYGSYEEMLKDPDIEAVYIATTGNFHYGNIKQCLQAGKHVICEKAMVATEEEAREAFRLADEKNLFLMEAMWSRFLPKTQKVREWVREGRIGRVKLIQGTIGFQAPKDPQGRLYNPDLGGGVLYDLGVYLIDLLPYFVDQRIVDTQAWIQRAGTGIDETVNLNLKLEDCWANGQMSLAAKLPEDAYIYGETGYIRIPKIHWGTEALLYDQEERLVEHFNRPEEFGFVYELAEAVRCIRSGAMESNIASREMTLVSSRIYDKYLRPLGDGEEAVRVS